MSNSASFNNRMFLFKPIIVIASVIINSTQSSHIDDEQTKYTLKNQIFLVCGLAHLFCLVFCFHIRLLDLICIPFTQHYNKVDRKKKYLESSPQYRGERESAISSRSTEFPHCFSSLSDSFAFSQLSRWVYEQIDCTWSHQTPLNRKRE